MIRRALVLLALFCAPPLHAQALGGSELAAGAALNITLRGPYIAASWRRPIPRLALGLAISVAYERFVDVNGWSWRDVRGRVVGYVATEAVIALIRRRL